LNMRERLKELCNKYVSSANAGATISRFINLLEDLTYLSTSEKKLLQVVLEMLRAEISDAYYRAYIKCIKEVDKIVEEQ